jgi:uncharacterized membrane protein
MSIAKWVGATAALALLALGAACSRTEASFARDVNPILKEHCVECHSAGGNGYVASGFSVESYDDVMEERNSGRSSFGSSVSSTLAHLIEHKADPSINMPQGKPRLSKEKLDIIRAWIEEGAKNN